MSSSEGHNGHDSPHLDGNSRYGSVETMLFESLTHQLIEKGLLTKKDALSIVQSVAHVRLGQGQDASGVEVALLRRLYESFEAMRSPGAEADRSNVLELRPPLHGDSPGFPQHD